MTTVAFRDGVMAADSRLSSLAVGISTGPKLFKKKVGKKEYLIGLSGDVYAAQLFIDWYGTDDKELHKQIQAIAEDSFEVLIWDGKRLLNANYLCRPLAVDEAYYAIGSGAVHAITAMDCGKTAAQAVQLAVRRDLNSGGRIVTMGLK